jgi:NADH:ubiquinone oxidoreductase subunit H
MKIEYDVAIILAMLSIFMIAETIRHKQVMDALSRIESSVCVNRIETNLCVMAKGE